MRVALVYSPPWKIPLKGETPAPLPDGPPGDIEPGDLDADFFQAPYGLFSLGAQALRAGHPVKVLNLSGFAWTHVEQVIAALDAQVWGLSCWTANRRGVALVAREIKRRHPHAHVIVGGPHATPLAEEMLSHHADIDTVALGESEGSFLELLDRLAKGEDPRGIAGTVYRTKSGTIVRGAERPSIADLDTLASPHAYFDTHIVMTSRGCPWQCTFCGADTTWGRGFRGQSVDYVLDAIEAALSRLPVKMVQIKDDTFTANRKRVLELCRGIRARGLEFVWSCDTRVDVLGDDLLREMRLAGCERLSLGVESGSPEVLRAIDKKITPDEIIASSALAKKYGLRVRYYMMLGNRGETAATFHQTLDFLARAQPHQYLFSCLSIYPGTRDFQDAESAGWLDREVYFSGSFQEYKTPYDCSPEDADEMDAWFRENKGLRKLYRERADDYAAILARLGGDHPPALLDLGAACFEEGRLDEAETHVRRALENGHPLPGVAHNYLACIAHARGDEAAMVDHLADGIARDPQHRALLENHERVRAWLDAQGPERRAPLELIASHDFELLERTVQPTLPGPLPRDFARWDEAPVAPVPVAPIRPTQAIPGDARRRLRVLPPAPG